MPLNTEFRLLTKSHQKPIFECLFPINLLTSVRFKLINKITYLVLSLVCVTLSSIFNDVIISVFMFYTLYLLLLLLNFSGSVTDPRGIISGFFVLYSTLYPLQALYVGYSGLPLDVYFLNESLFISMVFFVTMTNCFNLFIYNFDKESIRGVYNYNNSKSNLSLNITFVTLSILVIISLVQVYSSGVTSKRELLESSNVIANLSGFSFWVLTVVFIIKVSNSLKPLKNEEITMPFLLIALLFMLVTGERDAFFRVVLICLFIHLDKNNGINMIGILGMLLIAVIVAPVSQAFKAVFISGNFDLSRQGLELILSNEFTSASRNLYAILYFDVENDIVRIFDNFARGFLPGALLSGFEIESGVKWFNSDFRFINGISGNSGWGFSLVADGYIFMKELGVIIYALIYSGTICFFHNRRLNSKYMNAFYLMLFITSIYVIRADLSNFISQVFKIGGIAVITVYFSHRILLKKS